ncbi:hypothetical protein [Flavobacterium sp. SM2513]|uniref:hypothetical protein n=1 Tax=Flavobacterium sp. SM2513 TaxID=3424766 RepID=UPI003D7F2549
MKTLKLLVFGLLFITSTQAQVTVNVNLGTPPVWAPAKPVVTQYYYLPEIDTYYDVPAQRFIYIKKGKWVRAEKLPVRYSGYNLRNGKVIYLTDYRGSSPYVYHKKHKVKYVGKKYKPAKKAHVKAKHDNGKHKGHKKQSENKKHDD